MKNGKLIRRILCAVLCVLLLTVYVLTRPRTQETISDNNIQETQTDINVDKDENTLKEDDSDSLSNTLLTSKSGKTSNVKKTSGTQTSGSNYSADSGNGYQGIKNVKELDSAMDMEEIDSITVEDADPNSKIIVNAPSSYTVEMILQAVSFENVSSPIYTSGDKDLIDPDILVAEKKDDHFELSENGGFKEGDVYQITLNDDNLTFDGYQDEIRIYNLTIHKDDVLNASLNSEIKYQDATKLSEKDADEVKLFDGLVGYENSSGKLTANNRGIGSFESATDYEVGDIIAVYDGTIPDNRSLLDSDSSTAYIQIKEVKQGSNGQSEYVYESWNYRVRIMMKALLKGFSFGLYQVK